MMQCSAAQDFQPEWTLSFDFKVLSKRIKSKKEIAISKDEKRKCFRLP